MRNSFLFFVVKNKRTNAKSEQSKGRGLAICRRRQIYAMIGVVEIGPILRTDFRAQGCYSSIAGSFHLLISESFNY